MSTDAFYKIEQTESAFSSTPTGFASGSPTKKGYFVYQFNSLGTFYYWSGVIESANSIVLRGVIEVEEEKGVDLPLNVMIGGIQGFLFYAYLLSQKRILWLIDFWIQKKNSSTMQFSVHLSISNLLWMHQHWSNVQMVFANFNRQRTTIEMWSYRCANLYSKSKHQSFFFIYHNWLITE